MRNGPRAHLLTNQLHAVLDIRIISIARLTPVQHTPKNHNALREARKPNLQPQTKSSVVGGTSWCPVSSQIQVPFGDRDMWFV